MLKIQEIRELIKLLDKSSIDELMYEEKGAKIKLKKNQGVVKNVVAVESVEEANVPASQPPVAPVVEPVKEVAQVQEQKEEAPTVSVADENLHKIESPMVGTFYESPNPESDVYVKVGDKVSTNSIVCIVEAMKLFNEIEAEVDGEIVEVLVENGQLVEYGQPLFLVKTK
ncbi:acetyl-CoA carboxylase biotin carboxyl carrier protein [Bacillus solimangrovi]|uniref:Biotin carboxyl carrier protein of acetyl-CoA carboxylase n=1 Tax=Bacillus solimangrovi TaxID=1305675 RepID=A0A1E5LK73_9BACI|nr:acetyl-CoA carboxylase biotin carboxyl carrier protein [Bacillus solimangrovi]OEH94487.1 acetyl-CoA carboxylase, biotin carboxyl carrier protein [Bacillus solimangrovi]